MTATPAVVDTMVVAVCAVEAVVVALVSAVLIVVVVVTVGVGVEVAGIKFIVACRGSTPTE